MSITPLTVTIDLNPSYKKIPAVYVSQLDNNLRELAITVQDGGVNYDVASSGYDVYVEGTKPDKHGFSYKVTDIGGTVVGSVVTVPMQTQMTCVQGMVPTEIVLKSGSDRIGSANFLLVVEQAGLAEDVDVSETDIPAYIDGAQQAAAQAEASARKAQAVAINVTAGPSNPLTITDGAENMPVKDCVVNIEPAQSGSGTPTPSNVRTISGWTQCNVVNTTEPKTYSVNLSSAGTVYGGTLDVTTGLLTVTHGILDLGTFTWEVWPGLTSIFRCALPSYIKHIENSVIPNWWCEIYTAREGTAISSTNYTIGQIHQAYLLTHDSRYTSASDYTTAMNGVHLCYELATSQTYQLTPTEVSTLLNTNTFTCNCGTVSLTYFADTQTYINDITTPISDMIAPTEAEYKATRAYTVNDLLIVDGKLYKATASIANGATITPNTNVTQTTLSALIKALS